jgi:hypothetical protein
MRTATEQFIDSLVELDNFVYYLEEGFKPELLEREEARAIWHYVREYYERDKRRSVPSLDVLEEAFPKWDIQETDKAAHWILDKLKERWQFRESRTLINSVSTMKPDEVFPYVKAKLWEAEQVLDTERNVVDAQGIPAMWERYLDQWNQGDLQGFTTGFETIDSEMGGIRAGQLAIIGARLKTGKTWFGLKAFIEQIRQQANPLFITLELSIEEIEHRLMALWSGLSYDKIDKGYLSPQEMDELQKALLNWESIGPFQIVQPPTGQRQVADFVTLVDKYNCNSLIVDQLNWIEASKADRDYFRDDLRVGDIAKELKLVAQRPGREIPVYVMHQFNRQQKQDAEMESANYGDSDKIGQIADHLFGIAQTKELRDANQIRFEVINSRSARTGGAFTCDFEFYERTNMGSAIKGETIGEMTVDQAAILLGSG